MANNSKPLVMVPPKKPFEPKILYTFDLIFLVAFTVALIFLIPFDISADFVGETENSPEDITEFLESVNIDEGFFEAVFANGNLQSGGYVQAGTQNRYYLYEGTDKGGKYYSFKFAGEENYKKTNSTKVDGTGVITPRGLVTLDKSGRIFFDEITTEFRGSADFDWRAYASLGEAVNYEKITAMLIENNSEKTSLRDAAVISALIIENTLVGYSGTTAWFVETNGDGKQMLVKSTADGHSEVCEVTGYATDIMVADGKYLFYGMDGGLYVQNLEQNKKNLVGFNSSDGNEEELICFTYDVIDGGVRVHALTDTVYYRLIFTGDGAQYSDCQTTLYREKVEEPAVAISFADRISWIYSGKDNYHWYRLK